MSIPDGYDSIVDRAAAEHAIYTDPDRYAGVLAQMLAGKRVPARDVQTIARALAGAAEDLQWPARRYADGRKSYAVGMVNDATRVLLSLGLNIKPDPITTPPTPWAIDGMYGLPDYAHIEDAQAAAMAADREQWPESPLDVVGAE